MLVYSSNELTLTSRQILLNCQLTTTLISIKEYNDEEDKDKIKVRKSNGNAVGLSKLFFHFIASIKVYSENEDRTLIY